MFVEWPSVLRWFFFLKPLRFSASVLRLLLQLDQELQPPQNRRREKVCKFTPMCKLHNLFMLIFVHCTCGVVAHECEQVTGRRKCTSVNEGVLTRVFVSCSSRGDVKHGNVQMRVPRAFWGFRFRWISCLLCAIWSALLCRFSWRRVLTPLNATSACDLSSQVMASAVWNSGPNKDFLLPEPSS